MIHRSVVSAVNGLTDFVIAERTIHISRETNRRAYRAMPRVAPVLSGNLYYRSSAANFPEPRISGVELRIGPSMAVQFAHDGWQLRQLLTYEKAVLDRSQITGTSGSSAIAVEPCALRATSVQTWISMKEKQKVQRVGNPMRDDWNREVAVLQKKQS
jgi:hypothetical protein